MTRLASQIRRWKYKGKPTKKAKKVAVIAEAYERAKAASDMIFKQKVSQPV
jgi:hypothetical protein